MLASHTLLHVTVFSRLNRVESQPDAKDVADPTKLKFNYDKQSDADFDHAIATFDS